MEVVGDLWAVWEIFDDAPAPAQPIRRTPPATPPAPARPAPAPAKAGGSQVKKADAESVKSSSTQTGSYTNKHESGKKYHGKGSKKRADESAKRVSNKKNDPIKETDWKASKKTREAFKDEAQRIREDGGVENPDNYNEINSPGEKYLQQDAQTQPPQSPSPQSPPSQPPAPDPPTSTPSH